MDWLDVRELAVMHAAYRLSPDEMQDLLVAVHQGVVFSRDNLQKHSPGNDQQIAVVQFEDSRLFLRDGLHRATAIMLRRQSQRILADEFTLTDMTYSMFLRANPSAGFYTPFDPHTEVRVADWSDFRGAVERRIADSNNPVAYIEAHRSVYACRRCAFHDSLQSFFEHHQAACLGDVI